MDRRSFIKKGLIFTGAAALSASPWSVTPTLRAAENRKVKLKIGYLPITDHMLIMASNLEKFQRTEVEPVKFSSWPDISEAIKAGAIDGAFLLTPIGITLYKKGIPLQAVMLGHRNGSVITVKVGKNIKKTGDLRGKTIAIPSPFSTHNILLRKILLENKIPVSSVRIIDMAPPEMPVALATGRIDGYIVAEPFGAQAEFMSVGEILMLSRDIWKDHICCVLNINESVIKKHPESVKELVDGMVNTAGFIKNNPKKASEKSVDFLGQKPGVVEHVLTKPKGRLTFEHLKPEISDFEATQNYMAEFGIADRKVSLKNYVSTDFFEG